MGKKNADAWTFMARLLEAGINPAMLEAFAGSLQADGPLPDEFFQKAGQAMEAAQRALGSGFTLLFRESKIALLDFIMAIEVKTFTQRFSTANAWDEGSVIQAIAGEPWKLAEERKTRIVQSMLQDRLVFGAQDINKLRDGAYGLYMQKGPAVHYVQRLLQVALRVLDPKKKKLEPVEQFFSTKTTKALSVIQGLLSLGATGTLTQDTLAALECIHNFGKLTIPEEKDKASLDATTDAAWANVIGNKKLWVKLSFADFDAFMDFYRDLSVGKQLGPDELKKLKYALGPLQKEMGESFAALKQRLDKHKERLEGLGKKALKDTARFKPLNVGIAGAVLTGGVLWYAPALKRVLANDAQGLDNYLFDVNDALLKLGKFKVSPKTDSGLPVKVNTITLKGNLDSPSKSFTVPGDKTLGAHGSTSLTWTNHATLPSSLDEQGLKANDFKDEHWWYCEATCAHYSTAELRSLIQQGKIDTVLKVRDLKAKEPKDTPISQIPLLVNPSLVSKEQDFSVTIGAKAGYAYSPKAQAPLTHVGGELQIKAGPFSMKLEASSKDAYKTIPFIPYDPHAVIRGLVHNLGCTLQLDCLTGPNTPKHTNKLELSAGLKSTQSRFPLLLGSNVLSATGGATWNVVHQDSSSLKLSLVGIFSWEDSELKGHQNSQEVKSRLEYTGRKFTVTADVSWVDPSVQKPVSNWSYSIRFLYHFH